MAWSWLVLGRGLRWPKGQGEGEEPGKESRQAGCSRCGSSTCQRCPLRGATRLIGSLDPLPQISQMSSLERELESINSENEEGLRKKQVKMDEQRMEVCASVCLSVCVCRVASVVLWLKEETELEWSPYGEGPSLPPPPPPGAIYWFHFHAEKQGPEE